MQRATCDTLESARGQNRGAYAPPGKISPGASGNSAGTASALKGNQKKEWTMKAYLILAVCIAFFALFYDANDFANERAFEMSKVDDMVVKADSVLHAHELQLTKLREQLKSDSAAIKNAR